LNKKKQIEKPKKKEKKPRKQRDNSQKPDREAKMKLKSVNSKQRLKRNEKRLMLL